MLCGEQCVRFPNPNCGAGPFVGNALKMGRILITEKIAEPGLDLLRSAGHDVDVQLGKSAEEIRQLIPGAHGLIIRSSTFVDEDMLNAADELAIVGRAGVGLDNVDVNAATKRGVMVVNAPTSNVISAAEQTMTLIMAQARNTARAHAALVQGRWERSKWTGMELAGKTLGIVGLGRIGALVAQRALAFEMNLVGFDPYISADRARKYGVELLSLDELAAQSDIVTVHVARTPDTIGLIGKEFLDKAKDGVRIINVARGKIVDESALFDALVSGKAGGAGLDVFSSEPMTESPLFSLPNVTVTPHLGASTVEAQDRAGVTIAEQVLLALAGDFVPFAVNVDAAEVPGMLKPFLPLCESLGSIFAGFTDSLPSEMTLSLNGEVGGYDHRMLTLAATKGLLTAVTDEPVSFVNASSLLTELGLSLHVEGHQVPEDYVNLVTLSGGGRSVSATLIGMRNEARLVRIDDHDVDLPPGSNMLLVRNDDRPGMIGLVTTALGQAEVNIDDMNVGRDANRSSALMVLATHQPVPAEVVEQLRQAEGILSIDQVRMQPPNQDSKLT